MIIRALSDYYRSKTRDADGQKLPPFGFEWREMPFLIDINPDGSFARLSDMREGKNAPKHLLPKPNGRTSGILPNLLWDTAGYVLGHPRNEDDKVVRRTAEQHKAFVGLVHDLPTETVASTGLSAIVSFYDRGEQVRVFSDPQWESYRKEKVQPNLTFRISGEPFPILSEPAVFDYFSTLEEVRLERVDEDDVRGRCSVLGQIAPIASIHPGVTIGGSANVKLVSFQVNAGYDSYGKQQGANAPISRRVAFEYSTALDHLLHSRDHATRLGSMSIVVWTVDHLTEDESIALEALQIFMDGLPTDQIDTQARTIKAMLDSVKSGKFAQPESAEAFILGVVPNKSRLAVSLWENGSINRLAQQIAAHHSDLSIDGSGEGEVPSLKAILKSTVFQGKLEDVPGPLVAGTLRAALTGLPYPMALFQAVIRRIRAEGKPSRSINQTRASILKACINRWARKGMFGFSQEVHTMLDPDQKNSGYVFGRVFAVLEKIQRDSSGGSLNSTIRDRYYGSASSSPATVFPQLVKLSKHHLTKLSPGLQTYYEQLLGSIFELTDALPAHLSLQDQGYFALGYYHQQQSLYRPKSSPDDHQEDSNE